MRVLFGFVADKSLEGLKQVGVEALYLRRAFVARVTCAAARSRSA
jgi:hypothetical protein